jgi:hypothetical protein
MACFTSAVAVGVTVGARLLSGNALAAAGIDLCFAHQLSVGLQTNGVRRGLGLLSLNFDSPAPHLAPCQTSLGTTPARGGPTPQGTRRVRQAARIDRTPALAASTTPTEGNGMPCCRPSRAAHAIPVSRNPSREMLCAGTSQKCGGSRTHSRSDPHRLPRSRHYRARQESAENPPRRPPQTVRDRPQRPAPAANPRHHRTPRPRTCSSERTPA